MDEKLDLVCPRCAHRYESSILTHCKLCSFRLMTYETYERVVYLIQREVRLQLREEISRLKQPIIPRKMRISAIGGIMIAVAIVGFCLWLTTPSQQLQPVPAPAPRAVVRNLRPNLGPTPFDKQKIEERNKSIENHYRSLMRDDKKH